MDGENCQQDPLKKTLLFHHLRERTISKQNEKANVTIDLRQSSLIHMFTAENVVWKNHNNNDETAQDQISAPEEGSSPLGSCMRSQTARHGRRFHSQRGTSCRSEVGIQENDDVVPISQGNFSSSAADGIYSVGSGFGSCQPMESPDFEPKSSFKASHENTVGSGKGQSSVLDLSLFDLVDVSDQNGRNVNVMIENDSSSYNQHSSSYNQASTIIHLKVADIDCENVSRDSKLLSASKITEPTDLNVISEPEKRKGESVENDKKPSENDSSVDSDDEDLPLIMHCNRKRRAQASGDDDDDDHSETAMRQEVKRTYQRGNMMHHLSSSSSGRLGDRPSAERSANHSERFYAAGRHSTAGHAAEYSDKSERRFKHKNSDVRHRQRMLLEAYERSNQAIRNTCDVKEVTVKKFKSSKGFSIDETIKKFPVRKSAGRSMSSIPKSCLIGRLVSGPASVKRTQMKRLSVNPRMMSRILRQLTERNCPRNRTAVTFSCISHQNYYGGCLVYRLTRRLPARERVRVLVPTRALEELDQVSTEVLRLWKLSGSEVEELQKQVKQEMQHKRTEHIMPVLLQMSYEQIESAYEQVKKDMTTYEVTQDDTSDEDDEKEDEEFDDGENRELSVKASRGKSTGENLQEDVENAGDENLHLTSYEIIVHDESSKTVSCETVGYLEWREKHPALKNGASKSSKTASESSSDPKIYKAGKIIETVKPTEEAVKPTTYSQSRPKRLAVDYSPSAFAPIRFMEGKRLGGTKESHSKHPSKHSPDKKVHKSATPSRHTEKQNSLPASTTAITTTRLVSTEQELAGHSNTNGSESNISTMLNRNKCKESEDVSPSLAESPESPLKLDAEAPTSEVFVMTDEHLAGVKGGGRDDVDADDFCVNTAIDDADDDDVPVIVDMCEMPLAPETDPSSYAEEFSGDCVGTNGSERTFSAYDAVRNEYVRLRDTMATELSSTMATELSSTMTAAVPGDILQGGRETGSSCNDAVDNPAIEGSKLFKGNVNSNLTSLETKSRGNLFNNMASDPAVEAGTKIFDSASMPGDKDGGTLAHMPQLKLQCSDSCNSEAENPLAPPDLGLPIEYSDIRQHSASPVQPPVLLMEEEEEEPYDDDDDTGSSNPVGLLHPLIL